MAGNDNRNDVARYLDGAMSPEEERSFARRLTNDPELRLKLDAEQLIRASIAASVEATPRPPVSSRQRLERTVSAAPRPEMAAPATSAGIGGLSGTMIAVGGALLAAIVMIGFLLLRPEPRKSMRTPLPAIERIDTSAPAQLTMPPMPTAGPVSHRSDTPARPHPTPISPSHNDSAMRSAPARVDTAAQTTTTSSSAPVDSTHVRIKLRRPKIDRPSETDQRP